MQRKLPSNQELRRLYIAEKRSLREIGRMYKASGSAVQQALQLAGIPIRSKSEARIIALRKGKFKDKKLHRFDRNFFDEWFPRMAYVLGLVYADGHLSPQGFLSFGFGKKSLPILKNIKYMMGSDAELKPIDNHGFPSWRIAFSSNHMVERLVELGVPIGKKSLVIEVPDVPEDMRRHFVRGYFDGDGSVNKDALRFVSSSRVFLEGVGRFISDAFHTTGGRISDRKSKMSRVPQGIITSAPSYTLIYASATDLFNIYQWFYKGITDYEFSVRERGRFTRSLLPKIKNIRFQPTQHELEELGLYLTSEVETDQAHVLP